MAGTTPAWGYKFLGAFDLCHFALVSPYSNGAVQIWVGLELVKNHFGKLVHIFGQLVHIFGELAHIFARKQISRTSKQVSKNLGPLWQPGVYNDTNPNMGSRHPLVWGGFFACGWKLPAYSGALLLTVDKFCFFTYSWSFFAHSFSFSTYSCSFFTYSGKVRLIGALRDCKPRSLTVKSILTLFHADFGKGFPSRTLWRGPSWKCPSPRSVLCPLLYGTMQFSTGRTGRKGAHKRGEEGWPAEGAKRRKGRVKTGQYYLSNSSPRPSLKCWFQHLSAGFGTFDIFFLFKVPTSISSPHPWSIPGPLEGPAIAERNWTWS